ncbi:MAG TPA: hypothetical protein VFH68_21825 [Polyangia bacterium]|jgi:hypothetical protein|nr:hypothetical protein [Polyangia bacterium]
MKQRTALALALLMMGAPLTSDAKPARRRAAPRGTPAAAAPASQAAPAPSGAIDKEEPSPEPSERERGDRETPPPAAAETRKPVVTASNNDATAEEAKPAPAPAAPAAPPASSADLEKLRADYDRLRDQLFRSRARAQIVEESLWTSKLSVSFRWKGGPDYLVHHASVKLDGGDVWDSGDKQVTDDLVTVAERAIKPGAHAITLRIEIRPGKKSKDSDRLGYVSEHTFAIVVPDGKNTRVEITGDEDGDAPEYEPEIEVEVESKK